MINIFVVLKILTTLYIHSNAHNVVNYGLIALLATVTKKHVVTFASMHMSNSLRINIPRDLYWVAQPTWLAFMITSENPDCQCNYTFIYYYPICSWVNKAGLALKPIQSLHDDIVEKNQPQFYFWMISFIATVPNPLSVHGFAGIRCFKHGSLLAWSWSNSIGHQKLSSKSNCPRAKFKSWNKSVFAVPDTPTGRKRNWREKHKGSILAHGTCAKDTLYRLVWKSYGLVWKSCRRMEPSLPPLGLGTQRGMEETSMQGFCTQTIDPGQFEYSGAPMFPFFTTREFMFNPCVYLRQNWFSWCLWCLIMIKQRSIGSWKCCGRCICMLVYTQACLKTNSEQSVYMKIPLAIWFKGECWN